jgi:hypothetical protein
LDFFHVDILIGRNLFRIVGGGAPSNQISSRASRSPHTRRSACPNAASIHFASTAEASP